MTTHENTPAGVPSTDQGNENLARNLNPDHATPHRISLHPTSGMDWWGWCISVNGKPAIRFRSIDHAALAMTYLLDDMENGIDITRRAALWSVAEGALHAQDLGTRAYEIVPGWS